MSRFRLRTGSLALLVAPLLALSVGCSFSFGGPDSPEEVSARAVDIVRALNEDGSLGIDATECDIPADNEEGTTFPCLSSTAGGDEIRWEALITSDSIDVNSINLVTVEGLGLLMDAVADVVSDETGATYSATDLDCGKPPLILDETQEIDCDLTLADGTSEALIVSISDTRSGDFRVRTAAGG